MEKMDKESMLKSLATAGYNIGFGAKKHFATYDIVEKLPGMISLLVIFIGIGQLAYPQNQFNTSISTVLIVVSIMGFAISIFNSKKDSYEETGKEFTDLFYAVRTLYYQVKESDKDSFDSELQELKRIESEFNKKSISKQIFGSDWYAHYKFFFQMQIDWIKEGNGLSFWRDYVPKSLVAFIIGFALFCWAWYYVFVRGGGTC